VDRVVAIDVSPAMTAIAQQNGGAEEIKNVEFLTGTLLETPLPDASFDAVLALNVLHLIPEFEASIRRSFALLKRGGVFVSSTACLKLINPMLRCILPIATWLGKASRLVSFNRATLERQLTGAGFEILLSETPGSKETVFIIARKPAA
jgi:ubiquinone/menaquinone biosynthesis C-methylase UbiE